MNSVGRADQFVLLGAGFSRAIDEQMPLVYELGLAVLDQLGKSPSLLSPFGGNFEEWLSFLAVDQPWLNDQENLRNHALFADASAAVHSVISAAELEVIQRPRPEWLGLLVERWCDEGARVATFNYDLLVERSITESGRVSTWADIYAVPLEERHAPGSGHMLSANHPSGNVLRLYKLHGSTNWAYGGLNAPTNSRIVLTSYRKFWRLDDEMKSRSRSPRAEPLYSDLVPLIIPPTVSKSSYYSGLALRAQWRTAHDALQEARQITIIGYSFPPSDLTVRHFLSGARRDAEVTVVDVRNQAVEAVREVLPGRNVRGIVGPEPLAQLVGGSIGG